MNSSDGSVTPTAMATWTTPTKPSSNPRKANARATLAILVFRLQRQRASLGRGPGPLPSRLRPLRKAAVICPLPTSKSLASPRALVALGLAKALYELDGRSEIYSRGRRVLTSAYSRRDPEISIVFSES